MVLGIESQGDHSEVVLVLGVESQGDPSEVVMEVEPHP